MQKREVDDSASGGGGGLGVRQEKGKRMSAIFKSLKGQEIILGDILIRQYFTTLFPPAFLSFYSREEKTLWNFSQDRVDLGNVPMEELFVKIVIADSRSLFLQKAPSLGDCAIFLVCLEG